MFLLLCDDLHCCISNMKYKGWIVVHLSVLTCMLCFFFLCLSLGWSYVTCA